MKPNLKLTSIAAVLACAALANPAWSQSSTPTQAPSSGMTPSPIVGSNGTVSGSTHLRADCYDAKSGTLRTTRECAALSGNGTVGGTVIAPGTSTSVTGTTSSSATVQPGTSLQTPQSMKGPSPLNPPVTSTPPATSTPSR